MIHRVYACWLCSSPESYAQVLTEFGMQETDFPVGKQLILRVKPTPPALARSFISNFLFCAVLCCWWNRYAGVEMLQSAMVMNTNLISVA